jgi:activator of HSP90 ATPase
MGSNTDRKRSRGLTRRRLMALGTGSMLLSGAGCALSLDQPQGISGAAEAIHQEIVFAASPAQLYQALTSQTQFDRVMAQSEAVKSKAVAPAPAQIDARAGGAFALFGGYISGRFIELVPDQRIVQAWRVGSWKPGIYSVARFELIAANAGHARILFDHAGFPAGEAKHLAAGWYANYWNPMRELFG